MTTPVQLQLQMLSQGPGVAGEDLPDLLASELADLQRAWEIDLSRSCTEIRKQVQVNLLEHLQRMRPYPGRLAPGEEKVVFRRSFQLGFNILCPPGIQALNKGARQRSITRADQYGRKASFETAQRHLWFAYAEIESQILTDPGFKPQVPVSLLKGNSDANKETKKSGVASSVVQSSVCTGRIDSPAGGAVVEQRIRVTGVVEDVPPEHHVWIAHGVDPGGLFWPKGFELTFDNEGRFERHVYEGGKSKEFMIVLLLATKEGHAQLMSWMERSNQTGSYPGIPPSQGLYVELDCVAVRLGP
ncbi:hypothetical protein ACWEGE_15640 [Amycolatopsis sp. NPDC004747]